jgi:hypothetical protein
MNALTAITRPGRDAPPRLRDYETERARLRTES